MTTFEQFMANEAAKEKTHSFSCVMIDLPDDLAQKVKSWGQRNVDTADLFVPDGRRTGRETEPHVTVLYGIHTERVSRIRRALEGVQPFTVKLGKASIFKNADMDVLKMEVTSPDLFSLNEKLSESLYNTQTHSEYQPHVTLAYLKKDKGDKYKGDKTFAGTEFEVKKVVFSSWTGVKTPIRLKPDTKVSEVP